MPPMICEQECRDFSRWACVGRLSDVFVCGLHVFLLARSTIISPEYQRNIPRCSPELIEIHQNFTEVRRNLARTSNWSTLKRGITTTRPSHSPDPFWKPVKSPALDSAACFIMLFVVRYVSLVVLCLRVFLIAYVIMFICLLFCVACYSALDSAAARGPPSQPSVTLS